MQNSACNHLGFSILGPANGAFALVPLPECLGQKLGALARHVVGRTIETVGPKRPAVSALPPTGPLGRSLLWPSGHQGL